MNWQGRLMEHMDWTKRKSRGLKIFLMVAMCFCLCVTSGCKKKESEKTAEDGFCAEISLFDCLEGWSFCDKGIVRVEDGLIQFYEYETGRSYPLCSDAYCEHIPYSSSKNPDPVCEATMKELKRACIHGDYVYVIQQTGIQEIAVYSRNLRESGYRLVAKLPYCQGFSSGAYNAIIGDKAYLILAEIDNLQEDEFGSSYTSNDLYTYLVELDLQTGEYKTIFHIEDEKKYKIASTVYAKEGVYCHCYYEDIEMNEDFTDYTLNDYWDTFYYVPYDGSGAKELCPELKELTSYQGDELPDIWVLCISEDGIYYENEDTTKVECYRYDGKKETVFELPEGYKNQQFNGISGGKLLMRLMAEDGTNKTAGLDLKTGESLLCDNPDVSNYYGVCDEVFWKYCRSEEGSRRELWEYDDIFAEDGNMLFSVEY